MNNYLFLVFDINLYFYKDCCNKNDIFVEQVFCKNRMCFKMAHIMKKIGLPLIPLFYGKWKKDLMSYSNIIITDYSYTPELYRFIRKNTNANMFFYYMNSFDSINKKYLRIDEIKAKFNNRVYTYSDIDAKNESIKYKSLMFKTIKTRISKKEYDFLYIGRNKKREDMFKLFYDITKEKYINKIMIYGSKNKELMIKRYVDYYEYISNYVSKSAVILDFVNKQYAPVDLRVLEAIYYNKKLITNNNNIRNFYLYDCYKENILIINFDDLDLRAIEEFYNKKNVILDKKILEQNEFENWIRGFSRYD